MIAEIRLQWTVPMARASSLRGRGKHALAVVALFSIAGFACLGARSETDDPTASDPQSREERIEELRQAIERDHVTLEDLITRPLAEADAPLYDDPEMRAIARRLTEQVRALERLEAAAEAAR